MLIPFYQFVKIRYRLNDCFFSEFPLFPPQTEAVCDPQPSEAYDGGSAASEQTGKRLQHQPDAALFTQPALLQPQH